MAPVGQSSMQRTQDPQVFFKGESGSSAKSVITWPSSTQEPWDGVRMLVLLPNQPNPDRAAAARSNIGPSSTYHRADTGDSSRSSSMRTKAFIRRFMVR